MSKAKDNRARWFDAYTARLDEAASDAVSWARLQRPDGTTAFLCPCCFLPTLEERGGYEICLACFWEDDGQDDRRADEVWGGPNGRYSLSEARANFAVHLTMYGPESSKFHRLRGDERQLAAKRRLIEIAPSLAAGLDAAEAASRWTEFDAALAVLRDAVAS